MPAAAPVFVLDYGSRQRPRATPDRGILLASAAVTALIGVALLLGLADLLVLTWPSFGVTLIAVPVVLVAFAFFGLSVTAARGTSGVDLYGPMGAENEPVARRPRV